jgi:hypothetical protein
LNIVFFSPDAPGLPGSKEERKPGMPEEKGRKNTRKVLVVTRKNARKAWRCCWKKNHKNKWR